MDHTERSAAAAATERSSTKALPIGVCAQVNDFAQSYTDVLDSPRLLGADRTNFGLPAAGVVYANYNNLQKLQPWVFDGWCVRLARRNSTDSAARVQQHCNHSCYARRPTHGVGRTGGSSREATGLWWRRLWQTPSVAYAVRRIHSARCVQCAMVAHDDHMLCVFVRCVLYVVICSFGGLPPA